jgi:D-alanyl-D-alanine carboxypeptidase/D-alanyl-D-alanine-endopeptidase (penicillin-binding protein 4)
MEVSKERLFKLFPTGGASDEFTSETPYIYAKTGSLGNNYCLSGYLQTKSGKTLIFSFMNNHFRQPSSEVKRRMQLVFERIRDEY